MLKYWLFDRRRWENNQLGKFPWPLCVGSMDKPESYASTKKRVRI